MPAIARSDTSVLGRWWWTVDRWSLLAVITLAAFGILLAASASPAVAERLHLEPTYFLKRQALFLVPAIIAMFTISLFSPVQVRRLGILLFIVSLVLLVSTLFIGTEIKGAQRWIRVAGFSLQPSEFVKPGFAIFAAWMFATGKLRGTFPGTKMAGLGFMLVAFLLLAQPDIGQAVVVTVIWFTQWFLAGLPMIFVAGIVALSLLGLVGAYFIFPHVASRIDRFIDPKSGDTYQVDKAMEAFTNGGLFGTGPGEGMVKTRLPDAHADFIFAVAGEEFGLIACLVLVLAFAFVVLRGFFRLMRETDLFVVLAAAGLLVQFGIQALINMGSTVNLMPTKGMTLPFVSYGGSSLFALAIGMGMALALTRERPQEVS
jgi:cell division protein FtsW